MNTDSKQSHSEFIHTGGKKSTEKGKNVEMTVVGRSQDQVLIDVNRIRKEDEYTIGVLSVPDMTKIKPKTVRDDDDNDDTLPIIEECEVPDELIAIFPSVDSIKLQKCLAKYRITKGVPDDGLNDLNQNMSRDVSCRVQTHQDIVDSVNDYGGVVTCGPGVCAGVLGCILTAGMYPYCCKKHIKPDNFGYYTRYGQHRLLMPNGVGHVLFSCAEHWVDDGEIPKDDECNPVRRLGPKTVLIVGQNCIGSARKIGADPEKGVKDGDTVLFPQGRYVLKEEEYAGVCVVNLTEGNRHEIGELVIIRVRENQIGGAYDRRDGRYRLFLTGPAYVLHKGNYSDIEVIDRPKTGKFTLGPITFATPGDGQMAGAYHKSSGFYQVLTPGRTYILHKKDYRDVEIKDYTRELELGPYNFVTVPPGYEAGAVRVKEGKFIRFPPGETYQCNIQDYNKPFLVKKDSNKVVCGPVTIVTVEKGKLHGAYLVETGQFQEFDESQKEYILHEKEYRDITILEQFTEKIQKFGPNKVVTIPEGFVRIATNAGKLEILEPGFHKKPAEYEIKEAIPLKTFTYVVDGLEFTSKDSIKMKINANFVWKVSDPRKVALYPEGFKALEKNIHKQVNMTLMAKCSTYNRDEILLTKQDVVIGKGDDLSDEDVAKMLQEADTARLRRHADITAYCLEKLVDTSTSSAWGVEIATLTIKGFVLDDEKVQESFASIARSIIQTKEQRVASSLAIEKTNTKKAISAGQAEAEAHVTKVRAQAEAEVEKVKARVSIEADLEKKTAAAEAKKKAEVLNAQAQIEIARSKAQVRVEEARAETDAEIVRADADKKIRETQLEIKNKEIIEEAEAKAKAVRAQADAEHHKKKQEHEASQLVPEHVIEARKLERITEMYKEAVEHYGKAYFINPQPLTAAIAKVEEFTGDSVKSMMKRHTYIVDKRDEAGNLTVKTKTY